MGLAPVITDELLDVVRHITTLGTTVVIVEQSLSVAAEVAERIFFMERGEVRCLGSSADVLADEDLNRSLLLGAT